MVTDLAQSLWNDMLCIHVMYINKERAVSMQNTRLMRIKGNIQETAFDCHFTVPMLSDDLLTGPREVYLRLYVVQCCSSLVNAHNVMNLAYFL